MKCPDCGIERADADALHWHTLQSHGYAEAMPKEIAHIWGSGPIRIHAGARGGPVDPGAAAPPRVQPDPPRRSWLKRLTGR